MAGPFINGLAFFLDAHIMAPEVQERAFFRKLENPHLTFPETVQK